MASKISTIKTTNPFSIYSINDDKINYLSFIVFAKELPKTKITSIKNN